MAEIKRALPFETNPSSESWIITCCDINLPDEDISEHKDEPGYNSSREELKDNGAIPCAFCELSFPDEDEVISHMIAVHPKMSE